MQKINYSYLNIDKLKELSAKNFYLKYIEIFKNCEIIFKISFINSSVKNYFEHNGYLLKTNDGKLILTNDCLKGDYENKITENSKNYMFYYNLYKESILFDNIIECVDYLRLVKHDPAINYELKNLVDSFISEIYDKKLIKIEEIV